MHQSSGMPLTCFFYMIFYNQAFEMQTLLTAPKDSGYYGAAKPPVRRWRSHLSGLTEPPAYYQLLPFIGANAIDFTHWTVFLWILCPNVDLVGIINNTVHYWIRKWSFISAECILFLWVPIYSILLKLTTYIITDFFIYMLIKGGASPSAEQEAQLILLHETF